MPTAQCEIRFIVGIAVFSHLFVRASGVIDEHQRRQAKNLGLVGHEFGQRAAKSDRLHGERFTASVALVEDQVDDREHRGKPVGQQMVGRDAKRDRRVPDLVLGTDQPLGHRFAGDKEGTCDLLGRQAAQRP